MRVYDMQNNMNNSYIQARINEMLDDCGNLCQFVAGDINVDDLINVQDIILLVNFILDNIEPSEDEALAADMNSDGVLTILDVIAIVNIIFGSI